MSVRSISEMTYWNAMSHRQLGEDAEADSIFLSIYEYSIQLEQTEPKVDYFATSLPTMLLLNEDLMQRNRIKAQFLQAQALAGLGQAAEAETLVRKILDINMNHTGAMDHLDQIPTSKEQIKSA
jgi:hypothetical protein